MPIAVGNGSRGAQVSGNRRTKLEEPAPYALVGNIQTSLRKKILHIPIAQSEPGIEPNGASNDFRWKAVTFEGDGVHPKRLHRNHQIEIRALNVTMPLNDITASLCGTEPNGASDLTEYADDTEIYSLADVEEKLKELPPLAMDN